jgi:hypothetical protein
MCRAGLFHDTDTPPVICNKIDRLIKMLSKAHLRAASVNDDDFLTMSPLTDFDKTDVIISYADDDNKVWSFVLDSISTLIEGNATTNPYNRKPLPSRFIRDIGLIRELTEYHAVLSNNAPAPSTEPIKRTVLQECIDLFCIIDSLDHMTKIDWFMSLDNANLLKFYKELRDIWDYRANLTPEMKLRHTKDGLLFARPDLSYEAVVAASSRDLALRIIGECRRLVTEGRHRSDNSLGALWILTALTIVNDDARLCMPWLYASVA